MKLQDKYRYDSAVVGMDGIYSTMPNSSFFINSKCIMTNDHTVTSGHSYVLVRSLQLTGIELLAVDLVDVYYEEGIVHILLQDSMTQHRFFISQCMECTGNACNWMLIDLDYLSNKTDREIIKAFCEKN